MIKSQGTVQTLVSIEPACNCKPGALLELGHRYPGNSPTFTQVRALAPVHNCASVRSSASVDLTLRGHSAAHSHASARPSVHRFSSCSASHSSSSSYRNSSSSSSAARPCLEWPFLKEKPTQLVPRGWSQACLCAMLLHLHNFSILESTISSISEFFFPLTDTLSESA